MTRATKALVDELAVLYRQNRVMRFALREVAELHSLAIPDIDGLTLCGSCGVGWPCATYKAATGLTQAPVGEAGEAGGGGIPVASVTGLRFIPGGAA